MSNLQRVLEEFLARYENDWVALVREVLGGDPDTHQEQVLRWACEGERQISVRSGHGVGKTTVLAWCIVCHALTRFPQKTLCTAPTSTQLYDALAAETKTWFRKLPPALFELFEIKTDVIEHRAAPDESFTTFATSRAETPEALAGKHSENMMVIADEASGIPEQVFEASFGSLSGHKAVMILAGNPVRTSGLFFDTHHKLRGSWRTLHISCEGHPRITPEFIATMKERYGEDSNAYRVRVQGEFPKAQEDTIIPFDLVHPALTRDVKPSPVALPVWGVDCARGGGDKSALAKRKGNVLLEPTKVADFHDVMEVVGWVKAEWDGTPVDQRPVEILVDAIGIGAGVCDRLRELGLPARGINVAELPPMRGAYPNLRSDLWFRGKDWFAARDVNIAGDDELMAELIATVFTYLSSGKRRAFDKREMKKLGHRSPNRADAFLLTLAADAATAAGVSGAGATSWSKPLKRNIGGLP